MRYLVLFQYFNGLYWTQSYTELASKKEIQSFIDSNPKNKNIRIFEINKEVKIKFMLEEL